MFHKIKIKKLIKYNDIDTKKSGTALLLFRYLRPSHCLKLRTSNTEAHADMYEHTPPIE